MDLNKLTEKSQEAVGEAQALATRQGHQQVEPEHLLLALLVQEAGLTDTILSSSTTLVCKATRYGAQCPRPLTLATGCN